MARPGWIAACLASFLLSAAASAPAASAGDGRDPGPPRAPPPTLRVARPVDPCEAAERRRGPVEHRDDFVLAQPRLMQPATTPDTLGCGQWVGRVILAGSSSFGWRQSAEGNDPAYRAFLADAENWTLALSAAYGATDDLDVGLRLPVMWRGGGFMDSLIDAFHSLTGTLDNMRPDFAKDQYIVEGTLKDGSPWSWTEDDGAGLGNLEAFGRWRFLDGGRDGLSAALYAQATVPTGTGPFGAGGVAAGLQVVGAQRILRVFDLYGGAGGTWFSDTEVDGVEYERFRASAFAALEWRCFRWASVFAQLQWGSRLVANVHLFPGTQLYLNFGAKLDLAPRTVLELGFTENLEDQQSTSDFGVWFGLEHRF